MSDKTELPIEDLNLISKIDARLKHYNLIAPIEQVEGVTQYAKAIISILRYITKDEQYPIIEETEEHYKIFTDELGFQKINKAHFVLSQQEQPKEEVKERYKTSIVTNHSKYEVRVFGFETQEEAIELRDKIKALLQTL